MSKTSDDQAIRSAWADLEHIAKGWDWTAPRLLRDAEKAEAKNARGAGFDYPKAEQLAGLCETALGEYTTADLYGMRSGHRDVAIFAAALRARKPAVFAEWAEKHGEAIRAARARHIASI